MSHTEGKDLVERDSPKGIPKKKSADKQARDGLQQAAAIGGIHEGNQQRRVRWTVSRESRK